MVPPALTYRARLLIEGLTLAACGVVGSVALLLADARTTDNAGSTVGQLAVVAILLVTLGPLSVRRAMEGSQPAGPLRTSGPPTTGEPSATGEPTPLWHLPLVVAALTLPLVALGAWDAGLRVTAGCMLVGLAQALLLTTVVRADERRCARVYARGPGSRILRGTKLTHVAAA